MANYININGTIMDAIQNETPIDNGAFRYGYGLFETMLVIDGVIQLKQYHWDRLYTGMQQLMPDIPFLLQPDRIEEQVLTIVQKNNRGKLCRVRLQVYAGGGGMYGAEVRKAGFVIECFELSEGTLNLNENGLVVGKAEGLQKSNDMLSNLKSCNSLVYAVAAQQAKAHQWNDALICNTAGNIIESTIANIFWIKDGKIYTPPLTEGCVAGVMRRYLTATTGTITEQALTMGELLRADEVFLTNAIKRIKWVGSIGNKNYGCTEIKKISELCF